MSGTVAIKNPSLLELRDGDSRVYLGGAQTWYRNLWKRTSGCGPTNGSILVWYLAQTRPELKGLWPVIPGDRQEFLRLMEAMFRYITPTLKGVNSTGLFQEGALRFGRERGAPLSAQALDIPVDVALRPTEQQMTEFLLRQLEADRPVAFLNLSNGEVQKLDKWHWVSLLGLNPRIMKALLCDQGYRLEIDIGLWLRTTALGGGFVALDCLENNTAA